MSKPNVEAMETVAEIIGYAKGLEYAWECIAKSARHTVHPSADIGLDSMPNGKVERSNVSDSVMAKSGEPKQYARATCFEVAGEDAIDLINTGGLKLNKIADTVNVAELKAKYEELISAVCHLYSGESRHETALRCIRHMEQPEMAAASNALR